MAAHLACHGCAGLLHLGLDQGMAGLPHDRIAAMGPDIVVHGLGAFDLGYERRTRTFREDVAGEDDHQLVSPQDVPLLVHDADPVGVAVKGDPEIGLVRFDGLDERRPGSSEPWDRDDGSGKRPSGSEKSSITSHPMVRMIAGAAKPAVPLPESSTTLSGTIAVRREQAIADGRYNRAEQG